MNATESSIEKANSTITLKELWARIGRVQRFFNTAQDDWKRYVGMETSEKPDMPPPLSTYYSSEPPSGLDQLTQHPWILSGMVIGMVFSIILIVIGVYLQIRSFKAMPFIYLRTSSMSSDSCSSLMKWEGGTQYTKPFTNLLEWITVPGSSADFKSGKFLDYLEQAQINILLQHPLRTYEKKQTTRSCCNQDTKCLPLIHYPHTKKK